MTKISARLTARRRSANAGTRGASTSKRGLIRRAASLAARTATGCVAANALFTAVLSGRTHRPLSADHTSLRLAVNAGVRAGAIRTIVMAVTARALDVRTTASVTRRIDDHPTTTHHPTRRAGRKRSEHPSQSDGDTPLFVARPHDQLPQRALALAERRAMSTMSTVWCLTLASAASVETTGTAPATGRATRRAERKGGASKHSRTRGYGPRTVANLEMDRAAANAQALVTIGAEGLLRPSAVERFTQGAAAWKDTRDGVALPDAPLRRHDRCAVPKRGLSQIGVTAGSAVGAGTVIRPASLSESLNEPTKEQLPDGH